MSLCPQMIDLDKDKKKGEKHQEEQMRRDPSFRMDRHAISVYAEQTARMMVKQNDNIRYIMIMYMKNVDQTRCGKFLCHLERMCISLL